MIRFGILKRRLPTYVSFLGSLSTVVGDEKLTSREDRIGPLFMYVQSDEDTFLKPNPNRLMSLINLLVASSFAFE